jgi:hypothetical protein
MGTLLKRECTPMVIAGLGERKGNDAVWIHFHADAAGICDGALGCPIAIRADILDISFD